jgi:hypothetical protein
MTDTMVSRISVYSPPWPGKRSPTIKSFQSWEVGEREDEMATIKLRSSHTPLFKSKLSLAVSSVEYIWPLM